MKSQPSPGARIGIVALAVQLLVASAFLPVALPAFAQDNANPDAPRRGEPITLNFSGADIEAVARTMAVVTGRDVVVDPRVKGTMNLVTDHAIPPGAAFNQFASALRLQGFAVVEADGLYKVVPEADAKLQSSTVNTSISAAAGAGSNQIVTQIFRLNYESPSSLLPVLRPLIPPNNTINVNPGNNSLVITDYADNMRRLARIIASLDVPNASDIEVIPLKYSIATDMQPLIARLIEGGGSSTAPGGIATASAGGTDASFRTTLLADSRSNSLILRAANPARAALVRTLVEKLDREPAQGGNGAAGNIYVVYLRNADAVRLATTLRAALAATAQPGTPGAGGAAGGGGGGGGAQSSATNSALQAMPTSPSGGSSSSQSGPSAQASAPLNNDNQPSTGGQIQADPSTNSLIITAPEPQYRQLRAVIDRLDGRRAQVMVEALIVEVNSVKAAQFGVQWQTALGSGTNVGLVGTNSSLNGANIINLAIGIAGLAAGGGSTSAPPIPGNGFNFGIGHKIGGQYVLGLLANFFNSDGDANVLSTPNLLTLDNQEAKIVIGQNLPFPTGSYAGINAGAGANPFTTVERQDVGLTLRVRPQINENGTIKMTIYQEVSTVDANSLTNINGPTTNKRSIESSVLVQDGGLVMLGGLLSDTYNDTTEKVPGVGDIPVLGNLFKNQSRSRTKNNLMMFLRPVIMRDGASAENFANDRYDSIRGLQQQTQPEASTTLGNISSAPLLPALPAAKPASTSTSTGTTQLEGTQLIPPPRPAADTRTLRPGPLRGALPPTADPATANELP